MAIDNPGIIGRLQNRINKPLAVALISLASLQLTAQQGVQPAEIGVPFHVSEYVNFISFQGRLAHQSFTGPVTDADISYWIYLPQGYQSSDHRYPVIYHLHGLVSIEHGGWGAETINDLYEPASVHVIEAYERAVASNLIEPAILVFPNGYGNSLWSDSKSGNKPAETHFIRDIIPHIDVTYRSRADRHSRIVQGFSMGGFGAFKFAVKYPDLFAAAVNYDGAMHNWESISTMRKAIALEIYGNDSAWFEEQAPWRYVVQNRDTIKGKIALKANVGSITDFNRNFRDHLQENGIEIDYHETGCGHDLGCILDESGQDSFAFLGRILRNPGANTRSLVRISIP